ncbi:MAG: bifunctional oligoribonuclease/PAP phosphatase NrnA [candidate division WOR-3 bacterium]
MKKAIKARSKIVVATHIDPDCDGICSALAMARLVYLYKKSRPILFCFSPTPERYTFLLKNYEFTRSLAQFDMLIAVDSADIERIFPPDQFRFLNLKDKLIVNIDHHKSNKQFGDIAIIDEKASSACEIIYKIYRALGIDIDAHTAEIFYAGIYNETGGFVYPNTTVNALKICSELISTGIDSAWLVKKLNAKSVAGTKLLSNVLNTIRIENNVGIMELTHKMLKRTKAQLSDSENFISFLQAIEGVRVSVFFREEKDSIRISLRSDGMIDVNEFARKFGGGGHRLAAGIKIRGKLTTAKAKVLAALFKAIKNADIPQ